jgi:hypothetical protein
VSLNDNKTFELFTTFALWLHCGNSSIEDYFNPQPI